jgi:hypothetical protein
VSFQTAFAPECPIRTMLTTLPNAAITMTTAVVATAARRRVACAEV